MATRTERRRENYKLLIDAGFSPADARRLRDLSKKRIAEIISTGQIPPVSKKARRRAHKGRVKKEPKKYDPNGYPVITGKIKYTLVGEGDAYIYRSAYSYVISYQTKDKEGNVSIKYIVYQTTEPRTKKKLFNEVYDNVFGDPINQSKYDEKVIKSSMLLIGAYWNPNPDYNPGR